MTPERLAELRDGHFPDAWSAALFNELAEALEQAWRWHERDSDDLDRRRDALARVRDLCDGRPAHDYLEVARIRAAIEGDK